MANLHAGTEVLALDFPPAVQAYDATQIINPTNSNYSAGSPQVGVAFTAPTSGRVLVIIGGAVGNSAGDRIFLSPQVFEGSSASGTEILSPSVTSRGYSSDNVSVGYQYGTRESLLEGLKPGQTYYARVMHVVNTGDSGTSTQDIAARQITIVPVP